eukprot:TRINITY_DN12999_c0_g1_i1.p1 TRINITY_DN12999_c0_g1~~TRINITY_DN12999_c0_g1_i1.p1  ORF type:complete len:602 (+),score=126.92 TRINITY_DN12999_c0_g1_i1:74-1807(+)
MTMALGRKARPNAAFRRRTAWWVSVGAFCLTSLVAVSVTLYRGEAADAALPGSLEASAAVDEDDAAHARRLQYPDDLLISQPYRERKGWYFIFIHIGLICYALLGLNTVCDAYFTGSLDVMVEKWNVKPDVAGATFMAAGGSAPELFTSLIGAVITTNDVGFGTIVGSAVFNVLFVIGACGMVAKGGTMELTWWPLFRDCGYYIMSLCILAAFSKTEGSIRWWEAAILFTLYLIYCFMMYFNEQMEMKVQGCLNWLRPKKVAPDPAGAGDSEGQKLRDSGEAKDCSPQSPDNLKINNLDAAKKHIREVRASPRKSPRKDQNDPTEEPPETKIEVPEDSKVDDAAADNENSEEKNGEAEGEGGDDDEEGDDIEELMVCPEAAGDRVIWYLSLPIYVPLYYGIPKPTESMFLGTFIVSLLWIGGFSFFLVWWVSILGELLHIQIIIMSFTLLAAGTSIPDLVSSMAVARAGQGDMAVSSSIGSNIFDILVGLPVPWMVKIGIVDGLVGGKSDSVVRILSPYIVFYVGLLLFMVAAIILSIHCLGWILNRVLGFIMFALYLVFLVLALYAEFGEPAWLVI